MTILIAFGGAALVSRLAVIWGQVHGIYLWIVSVLVFTVFLGTFHLASQKIARKSEPLPDGLLAATKQPASQSHSELPALRPKIVPVRYGASLDRHYGLFVRNDGEPAFDISIENVSIGTSQLQFCTELQGLTKYEREVLFEASIELSPGSALLGSGLRDVMIKANIDAVPLSIKYKDGENRWYTTTCNLERDFRHGIRAGFIRQETLPAVLP
jgi:hypothetical protein